MPAQILALLSILLPKAIEIHLHVYLLSISSPFPETQAIQEVFLVDAEG